MNIIHLSHTDAGAGAGRAAYRIHCSVRELGIQSTMLVADRRTNDPSVVGADSSGFGYYRRKTYEYFEAKLARSGARDHSKLISPARFGHFNLASNALVRAADVVCLYWINGAFIKPESLSHIRQPIVWRLSDTWPFTGGCHYQGSCTRFRGSCGNCPQLAKPAETDLTRNLWNRKANAWSELNMTIVAPSNWLANLARESALFAERPIRVITTGVDLQKFAPSDKGKSRKNLNLPQDKLLIGFDVSGRKNDARKGYKFLREAIELLSSRPIGRQLTAVTFGGSASQNPELAISSVAFGHIEDDAKLVEIYTATDLVIVPSLEDNLPNVGIEAIACGAPVIGFDVGGMSDLVRHNVNGSLIANPNALELANEIERLLSDIERLPDLSYNARQHALEHFSIENQARSYVELYRELIG